MAMMMRTKMTRKLRTAPAIAMPMIVVIPSCGPEFKRNRKVLASKFQGCSTFTLLSQLLPNP